MQIAEIVVSQNKIGKTFVFEEKMETEDVFYYEFKYIGSVSSQEYDSLKLVNCILARGLPDAVSHSAWIYLHDKKNHFIGKYYVGGSDGLPLKLQDDQLLFWNEEDCTDTTLVSFRDSVPISFFVRCTDMGGDIWSFEGR